MLHYAGNWKSFSMGRAFPRFQKVSKGPNTHSWHQKEPYYEDEVYSSKITLFYSLFPHHFHSKFRTISREEKISQIDQIQLLG